MLDKNLVHPIIGGKYLDRCATELSLNLGLTSGHVCLLPHLIVLPTCWPSKALRISTRQESSNSALVIRCALVLCTIQRKAAEHLAAHVPSIASENNYFTRKTTLLVRVPLGVVTLTNPVVLPAGTVVWM